MLISNVLILLLLMVASNWLHSPRFGQVNSFPMLSSSVYSNYVCSYSQFHTVEIPYINERERKCDQSSSVHKPPLLQRKFMSYRQNSNNHGTLPVDTVSDGTITQIRDIDYALHPPPTLHEYLHENATLCTAHRGQIQQLWSFIRSKGSIRHFNESDCELVVESLTIAYIALRGKNTVRSLEESIEKAAGIAAVLGELKADTNVVLAGILHDVVSDVDDREREYLTTIFGDDVVQLSHQYCRLPRYMARRTAYTDMQAENQLQMLVVLAEDYRTLYIRLAERLHTMRALRSLPIAHSDRMQIALEARSVYAALAHKMGVMKVRCELEDLSFKILEPDMFQMTRYTQTAAEKAYRDATTRIEGFIHTDRILIEKRAQLKLTHRIKSKYQLYLKMQRKGFKSPNEVRDALGLRLIVDIPLLNDETEAQHAERKVAMCYYIVNRLRRMPGWEPAREGFKDYIRDAKANGYQSLHQYIRNVALGTNVEVQVRTKEMHVTAELGQAAHWCYKDHIYRPEVASSKTYLIAWRSPSQMQARSSAELIGLAKKQLRASRVYVYLEDMSTVLNLQNGATALDGAFAIHTMLGLTASDVLVNNQSVELSHTLSTGDVITVNCFPVGAGERDISSLTLKQAVRPSKMGLARTKYALAALRKYFKQYNEESLICMGIIKLLMAFDLNKAAHKLALADAEHLVDLVKTHTNLPIDEFLCNLGFSTAQEESDRMLAQLFLIPSGQMATAPYPTALVWASMQGHQYGNGWEDEHILHQVLLPLLQVVLPPLSKDAPLGGATNDTVQASAVEQAWCEMVGAGSLVLRGTGDQLDTAVNEKGKSQEAVIVYQQRR